MSRWHLLWVALLAPLPSACSPPHMYQRATIRIENGKPCFSVNDTKESRRVAPMINGAFVVAREADVWRDVWRWDMPYPTSIPLRPAQCIPYGHQGPPGNSDIHESLRSGTPYVAYLRGEVPNPYAGGDPTVSRQYRQEFCVREGPQGREIVLVPQMQGIHHWEVCDTPNTPAIPGILNSE